MPICTILIGLPGSGKSTALETINVSSPVHLLSSKILSTDDIVERISKVHGFTYNEGWPDLIKFAEKVFWRDVSKAGKNLDHIIIDRTNLTIKSRSRFFEILKPLDYEFRAIHFAEPEKEEWERRLNSRLGKTIPLDILNKMKESFQEASFQEGFSDIIFRPASFR